MADPTDAGRHDASAPHQSRPKAWSRRVGAILLAPKTETGWDNVLADVQRKGIPVVLLEGLDEIALTRTHQAAIDAFRTQDRGRRPWAYR